MSTTRWKRGVAAAAFGVAVAAGVGAGGGRAAVAATAALARVGRVETPLGLQGARGAGANVGIIFTLVDPSRRKTDVEVEYGVDRNGDGKITDGTELNADGTPAGLPNEYRAATEDRIDARNTRRNRAPQLYSSAGDIGAVQEFVWKSRVDVTSERFVTTEYKLTPQGRLVPDPDNPGSFLFATGPTGTPIFAGVKVRVRAVRTTVVKRRAVKVGGAWGYSESFSLNNNNAPTMTIDGIDTNGVSVPPAADENVMIHWTASDADSEDLDGDGTLDIAQGEDRNGNGKLDAERVGVAFDYHRLGANENPALMTPAQIAGLSWLPCTRAAGLGDTDALDAAPGVPLPTSGDLAGVPSAPPGTGRHWTFAWNSVADVGTVYAKFVFRARTFDQKREFGGFVYRTTPLQLDNWRIFNPGYPAFPLAQLDDGRVGHTVTRVQSAGSTTDPLDRGDDKGLLGFQSLIVAGGAAQIGGGAVDDLDLMAVNTIAAETSTSSRVALHLSTARAFHTATALDDGRILFVGGFDAGGATPLASTEIYDPKTQVVTAGPSLLTPRAKHAAVKLSTGDVAVFGGVGAGGATLRSVELIQFKPFLDGDGVEIAPSTWTVAALPDLGVAQSLPLVALLPDQTVLVTGGVDAAGAPVRAAQLLDPLHAGPNPAQPQTKAPTFIDAPDMLAARKYGTATALIDGDVLFAGGSGRRDFEVFNWKTRAFEPVDPVVTMSVPRAQHVAPLLGSGNVLLIGGADDPDAANPAVTPNAEVFQIGARSAAGVWGGSFVQINGSLNRARRLAKAAVVDSGRTFIVGGADALQTTPTVETYTGRNGGNLPPKARVFLPTTLDSWSYGTPLYFRLTDPEQDKARVQVQYVDRTPTGDRTWRAASPQATTLGGDVAEATADLATALVDDQSLGIDPVAHNTPGDHVYIWGTSLDVPRPAVGATVTNGYNLRVIPFGAVRGVASESPPISILYNTKVVPTIWPFENYADQRPDVTKSAGQPTPNQAGDVRVWVHLRDIDGPGPHSNGDPASVLYQYAIDKNGDGLIRDTDDEFWFSMTPKGAAVGHATTTNPQVGLATYYDAPTDSNPAFPPAGAGNAPATDAAHRPAAQGWTYFDWDSVYDIGTPPASYGNVFVRVTPSDTNNGQQYTGVVQTLRNIDPANPVLTIVRHPDSVYLLGWQPRFATTVSGGAVSKASWPINDPIDFTFNGNVDPATVDAATLPVYRGTTTSSQVRGQYTVVNDMANHTALVTFWPDPQSLSAGSVVYGQSAASTVLFPNDDYSFRIPGYVFLSGAVPPANPPTAGTTIRPLGGSVAAGVYSTYLLVQAVPVNSAGTDAAAKFHTSGAGVYADDGAPVSMTDNNTQSGAEIAKTYGQGASDGLQFTFSRALDPATVGSPNLTTTLSSTSTGAGSRNTNPVVPGQWTVTNTPTVVGDVVTTTSTIKFVPLLQLPPSETMVVAWNAGLRATNGHSVPNASFSYVVETYARVPNDSVVLESFSDQSQNDSTGLPPNAQATTASWGTEGCVAGALSGASNGLGLQVPTGSAIDLILPNPQTGATTMTLTSPVGNYHDIVVGKNCVLTLACPTTSMTLNASGSVTIAGTVGFKGASGWNGVNGQPYYYMFYGAGYSNQVSTPAARLGGVGVNGGGSGGSGPSVVSTNTQYRIAGNNGANGLGTTVTYGQGGRVATETGSSYTARYLYGAGGGAGGGNGAAGLAGGRDLAFSGMTTAAGYGAKSVPGSAANDAFLGSGMTGGGGGGGGGACNFYAMTLYGYLESGGGGAGAGAVSIVCAGSFTLTPNGLIDGRGGNGGGSHMECGSGGGGAGGTLKVLSFGPAKFDGLVDLRGGKGGAKSFGYDGSQYSYANVLNDKTTRYGGDGGPGRLLVVAPNFGATDEVRVFGQMMIRQIASIPSASGPYSTPPNTNGGSIGAGFNGAVLSGRYTIPAGVTELDWTTLNIASGAVIDLTYGTATAGTGPVKIFVQGAATINGTLRLNADSTTSLASGSTAPTAAQTVQNFMGRPIYPGGQSYASGSNPSGPATASGMLGMRGSLGGGDGGRGCVNGTNATGHEGGNGFGPAPGVHNMNANTGYFYSSWYQYVGDTGGSGGANATDGEDGWAPFGSFAEYNYLGAFNNSTTTGLADQRGGGVSGQTAITPSPKRLGAESTDVSSIALANLSSFVGSGGGGGNSGGEGSASTLYTALLGSGGGGAGALAIVSPVSVTVNGEIQARGGDGQTPGLGTYSGTMLYMHAGGGGGSGGTVYVMSDVVNIGAVSTGTGTGGATFDLRGGLGGGYRSQNQFANDMAYPEYNSVGSFGGNGGYGRLVVDYRSSLNAGRALANRWGMEQTTPDASSNTFKTLAGTSRFYCPGMNQAGNIGRSKWYDLRSVTPVLSTFTAGKADNVSQFTLRVEGAQSLPNAPGSAAGTWGAAYAANTGDPDPSNTSGLFSSSANPLMTGWRFLRFDATFTRATSATGAPVAIDDMRATYTSDL